MTETRDERQGSREPEDHEAPQVVHLSTGKPSLQEWATLAKAHALGSAMVWRELAKHTDNNTERVRFTALAEQAENLVHSAPV